MVENKNKGTGTLEVPQTQVLDILPRLKQNAPYRYPYKSWLMLGIIQVLKMVYGTVQTDDKEFPRGKNKITAQEAFNRLKNEMTYKAVYQIKVHTYRDPKNPFRPSVLYIGSDVLPRENARILSDTLQLVCKYGDKSI
jgi:hypothetical protein